MLGALENNKMNESQNLILYRLQSGWKNKAKYAKSQQHRRTRGFTRQYGQSSEKAMAPHSSTLAWKIPWTEEPGGLQSMGSLRVRHD